MKNQRVSLLYLLFIALLILVIVIIVVNVKNNRVPQEKYQPFAFLPEINISQSPNFVSETVINENLGLPPLVINQEMLHGQYQRYPLNRKMQTTSVVAVSADQNNPKMLAWLTQTSADTWNFVWPDPASYYWTTIVDVHASPVVVVKGKYPRCRYFGYFPYTGLEQGDNGTSFVGQGIDKTWMASCNPTVPGDCMGLLDKDIEPDPGSKNPFVDPTYQEGDDNFYTIYFVSPYYSGKYPASKNILPLTIYGLNQSMIVYRIYAPFNPKGCNYSIYSSELPFNTKGCPNAEFPLFMDNNSGGSVHPEFDKSSPCETTDKVCIQDCVNYELGQNMDPDCFQYVNGNKYCVCEPENYYGKCGQYMEKTIRKCSNGQRGLANYCASRPEQLLPYCIKDIPLDPELYPTNPRTGLPTCPFVPVTPEDNVCKYVYATQVAQCAATKLYTNKDCEAFKNPMQICDNDPTKPGTCAYDFADYLGQCSVGCARGTTDPACLDKHGKPVDWATAAFNVYCQQQKQAQKETPPYVYQPDYDFVEYPKQCEPSCNRYTCTNGFCVPDVQGEFNNSYCDNECVKVTPAPTSKPTKRPVPLPTPRVVREDYEVPPDTTNCVNKFKASSCNRGTDPYQNVANYWVNSQNEKLFASSGWVGLPDVFVKYSYNNYFIRLNNSDQVAADTYRTLFAEVMALKNSMQVANDANPSNPFDVVAQNQNIDMPMYVQAVTQNKEMYQPPIPDYPIPPIPTGNPFGDDMCPQYLDRSTYLQIGTQYPKTNLPSFKTSTVRSDPPGCNYYADYCACDHNGKKNAPPCNVLQRGFTDCKGNPCYSRWGLQNKATVFTGEAKCFGISGNTGETIVFPNPDAQYIACATVYDPDSVYVVWMDVPSSPLTPSYANILKKDYDMRYWSVGHYYWAMGLMNQRPALSGLSDQEFKTVDIAYNDDKYGNRLQSKRVCIVLATYDQMEYMRTYKLVDERLNWLNWGKLQALNFQTPPESPPPYPTDKPVLSRENFSLERDIADAAAVVDSLGVDLNLDLKGLVKKVVPKKIPMEGMIILRQILPEDSFTQSIANYVKGQPDCLAKTIPLDQFPDQAVAVPAPKVSKSCNPGYQPYCDKYGLDPCCLSTDPLYHMRQYYPRCEKVKICDVENMGTLFWDKYLNQPLPYVYTAETPDPQVTCAPTMPPSPTPSNYY